MIATDVTSYIYLHYLLLGRRLLARNRKSASLAVINNYPDHLWLPWKFVNSPLPPYYWKSLKLKLQQRDAHAVQIARLMVLNKTDPLVAPCLHRLGGEHVVEALITHIDLKDSASMQIFLYCYIFGIY